PVAGAGRRHTQEQCQQGKKASHGGGTRRAGGISCQAVGAVGSRFVSLQGGFSEGRIAQIREKTHDARCNVQRIHCLMPTAYCVLRTVLRIMPHSCRGHFSTIRCAFISKRGSVPSGTARTLARNSSASRTASSIRVSSDSG